ncbi:ATP-binding protein [Clostridium sp. KNHs214]|uniref:HD domain-containing protein n=1 Tax=Clostridium sp. KNHs214 TaxID=1540257 RepID=UPI0005594C6D|nr:ATP-binding protein [Clostridium sp. KNHs214]
MIEKVQETHLYEWLRKKDSKFLTQLNEVIKYANDVLPLINNVFTNYTVHGIRHSIDVMEYMYNLISDIDQLSELEVISLIYSALLHDIGMVTNNDEIRDIKNDNSILGERKYSKVLEKFGEEKIALQECIRPIHGRRAKEYIEKNMDEKLFLIPESTIISFRIEISLICMSHNEDFEWIEKNLSYESTKGRYALNSQYIAVLLRIADYLDIDEQRAPLYLYKYLAPTEYSDLEWKQHFVIENYDKVFLNERTGLKELIFQGSSQNPTVHRKLLKYFDSINGELKNAVSLCEKYASEKYLLVLKTNVINKIQTNGFSFSDLRLSLDYNAVTNLLMGEHIYGDKKFGLRELIQNSIDACKTMEETSRRMEDFRYQKYQPFISITLDKDRKQVTIMDNGSGMSINILKKYFLNVGVSYYVSDEYLLQGRKYSPIGHYGIGFLACFMLSDKVEVKTVYYEDYKMNRISFERNSEYICLTYEDAHRPQGTEIILDYDQCLSVFDNKIEHIVSFIENNFLYSGIPIKLSMVENGEATELECKLKRVENTFTQNICLNEYLNGVEAYIDCNYKQINFAGQLRDINGCESYYYNNEKYSLDDEECLLIKDCVEDAKIRLLNIPIISDCDEYDFLKAYEVLEDYDEALNKIGNYNSINVWGKKEEIDYGDLWVDMSSDKIVGGYTLGGFRDQFGHGENTPVKISTIVQDVINNGSRIVLPYNKDCRVIGKYNWIYTDRCYLKDVLLSGLKLKIPNLVDGISLKEAIVNITNSEFVPNVSRSNIGEVQQKELSYAIGKALHMWIRDNATLNPEQRELLTLFIETEYSQKNSCLK